MPDQQEHAVEMTTSELRQAVDQAHTPIMMVNRDFVVTYVNRATHRLLAQHAETFGKVWPDFDPEKIIGTCIDTFHQKPEHQRALLANPENLPFRTDIRIRDLVFQLQVSGRFDDASQLIGHTLEWSDVTRLRERERTAATLQLALDQAQTAIMMVDRDFIVQYANQATEALLTENESTFRSVWPNFEAANIVGTCIDAFHQDPSHQRELLADPANLPYRTDIRIANLTFELQVSGQFDEDGALVGHTLEWSNVTATRAAEAKNADYQRQVAAASRTMAIIHFEPDGTVIDANENFTRTMGYSLDQIVGGHHSMFGAPGVAETPEYQKMWARLRQGEFIDGEIVRYDAQQNKVWLQATYAPIQDDKGATVRVTKFAFNVTEMVRARHRVAEAVDQLLAVASAAAEGDLTQGVRVTGSDPVGRLGAGFGEFLSKLEGSLASVDANTSQLNDASAELDDVSESLSEAVAAVASRSLDVKTSSVDVDGYIRAVSTATQEMSASIAEIASSASNAATVAESAVSTAASVQATVGTLGTSSEEIGKVVKVISTIAAQTNLLALNATIEAARAGEAGRGFAVVANEVKELAKGTAAATEDISRKVQGILSATTSTTEAMSEVSTIIEEISEYQKTIASAVKEQSVTTQEIEKSALEAADRSQEIVRSMEEVESLSREASHSANQASSASSHLSGLANSMKQTLGQFKLRSPAQPRVGDGVPKEM